MAKRRNTGRRKQEHDDETIVDIVEAKEGAQEYFERNKMLVLSILGAAILLIGGYLFYKYGIIKPKEKAVMESMYQAEYQFARDSFALALENPGGESEGFLDIIDNYGGTEAANTAKYYAGLSYLNLGRYQEAVDYLESYSPSGSITPSWANGALGDAYAELGEFEKAFSKYKSAASSGDDASGPYYLNKAGLMAKKLGNNAEAVGFFQKIIDEYPLSQEANSVERYISLLSSGS